MSMNIILYLQGHFVRSLGKIGEREAENEVILLEHDVPHSKFSDKVLACLPKETWKITASVSYILIFITIIYL